MAEKHHLWEAWRDGKRIEVTDYKECIPSMKTMISMAEAGYKFKVEGKAWKPKKEK